MKDTLIYIDEEAIGQALNHYMIDVKPLGIINCVIFARHPDTGQAFLWILFKQNVTKVEAIADLIPYEKLTQYTDSLESRLKGICTLNVASVNNSNLPAILQKCSEQGVQISSVNL